MWISRGISFTMRPNTLNSMGDLGHEEDDAGCRVLICAALYVSKRMLILLLDRR